MSPEYHRQKALEYYYRNKDKAALKAKQWRLNNLDYIKQNEDKY